MLTYSSCSSELSSRKIRWLTEKHTATAADAVLTALKITKEASAVCPPLQSAAGALLSAFEICKVRSALIALFLMLVENYLSVRLADGPRGIRRTRTL